MMRLKLQNSTESETPTIAQERAFNTYPKEGSSMKFTLTGTEKRVTNHIHQKEGLMLRMGSWLAILALLVLGIMVDPKVKTTNCEN